MNNKPIRKAVIPAAGLGTRFLPATKAIPKEMLPIVDIPTIQYIIKEAKDSGIEEILVITNSNKHCMENHFDRSYELESRLRDAGKEQEYNMICDIANMSNIYYVRQKEPKGLGHAIYCAKSFIGDEPFAVLLGDDVVCNEGGKPALKQLIDCYSQVESSVVGVQKVKDIDIHKYGIIDPAEGEITTGRSIKLNSMVEKPSLKDAPSKFGVLGRYILTSDIFDILERTAPGANHEIQLTDAIKELMKTQSVYAYDFEGVRYDVGDKFGFIQATIDFALNREDIHDELKEYIIQLANKIS